MSDDWKPGDEAQCVNDNAWRLNGDKGPSLLNIYTVRKVRRNPKARPGYMKVALSFAEFPGWVYCHTCFRKPPPPKEEFWPVAEKKIIMRPREKVDG